MISSERSDAPRAGRTAWVLAAMAVVALLPFAAARIPSAIDWAGHVGRYHVMLAGGRSPALNRFYAFDWHLVGNLGVDLLVRLLGPVMGAEAAGWLVTAVIPLLTIAGIAAVARAAYGRIEPAATLAACLVFGNAFFFGFLNFCLAIALALLAFAAWIRVRERRAVVHLALLTPLVALVWLAHAIGWGTLGLLVVGFEAERLWRRRTALSATAFDAGLRLLAFAPPLVLTLAWRQHSSGALFQYYSQLIERKAMAWVVILRGQSPVVDLGTLAVLLAVAGLLLLLGKWRIDWRIGNGAVLLVLACLAMPSALFDSWGPDERLAPVALMVAFLSLRWRGSASGATRLATFAGALFALRTVLIALSWHMLDTQYASNLRALDRVPHGARIAAMVLVNGCHVGWQSTAYPHLADLAIVRRDAFVNAEWAMAGAPLLRIVYPVEQALRYDPAQLIDAFDCAGKPTTAAIDARLAKITPRQFDYVWMLDTRGRRGLWRGHAPQFEDASSALYAVR